jgi:hypothetical protein
VDVGGFWRGLPLFSCTGGKFLFSGSGVPQLVQKCMGVDRWSGGKGLGF